MLTMNYSFPKRNLHSVEYFSFIKFSSCLNLQLQGVGLQNLQSISLIFPNLQVLDVEDNRISSMGDIEVL